QGFALVSSGDFQMGCNQSDTACSDAGHTDERPRITVTLGADYCIELTEVPVAEFRACVVRGTCDASPTATETDIWANWTDQPGDREEHPVNAVTWDEARTYCNLWMNGDLPTEAEWEKAARGGADIRAYPGGDADPVLCAECNWDLSGPGQQFGCNQVETSEGPATWPAGNLAAADGDSPYGLKDMAGNVGEWVRDCYLANMYSACTSGCTDPVNECTDQSARVTRGGNFSSLAEMVKVVRRSSQAPSNRSPLIGFRCTWRP
ncbi:MAG: formylglycine-generating enzyme family protein, partial [Polyangia bacterium]|nr:formylglycine-generating enzyme family protein [Polyangia bacterium]